MRIHDDRYSRDRLRFRHGAALHPPRSAHAHHPCLDRAHRRSHPQALPLVSGRSAPAAPTRHRGKSPHRAAFFTRTRARAQQSALLASLCRLLGALPAAQRASRERRCPSLERAELLCQAFEVYRDVAGGEPLISFEHAVFLLSALARADELVLGACRDCGALLVIDRWSLRAARCAPCEAEALER